MVTDVLAYDLPNADYQAEHDYLSSTRLKRLLPEHFKPAARSQAALDEGQLFHTTVLQPELLPSFHADNDITVLDPARIGVKADGKPADQPTATKAWKDAVVAEEREGRRVYTSGTWAEMVDQADAMATALADHDLAAELLWKREGVNEVSAFADVDGVPCRARFDRLVDGIAIDLKTTIKQPGRRSLGYAIRDLGYDLAAAHYLAVADALELDVMAFVLIFVAKEDPHYVTVVELSDMTIQRGRDLRDLAIARHLGQVDAYEGATGFLTI